MKKILLRGQRLAEFHESIGEFDEAYQGYLKVGNHVKAGKVLEKLQRWHEAANLYISSGEVNLARRAIENCFKRTRGWETFELQDGKTISIEDWLKNKGQTRRFVRYIKDVEVLNREGTPLIVVLANKLRRIFEFKSAAELYEKAFYMVNKKENEAVKNEIWLRYASECFARAKLYEDAARCMNNLILIEVSIGRKFLKNSKYNPYRSYITNLQLAREFNFLNQLIDVMGSFDPFRLSYDLLKIGEPEMSIDLFFKYYGKISHKSLSEEEIEIRTEKISFCLTQYVLYYRKRKEYIKAAEMALLNSQKEIAAELFKKAQEAEAAARESADLVVEEIETEEGEVQIEKKPEPVKETRKGFMRCVNCGEDVEREWEICPNCGQVLELNVCVCGQKIKPHWIKCPYCQRKLGQAAT